jgi:hypothetical protein
MGLRPLDTPSVPRAKLILTTFMKILRRTRNVSSRTAGKQLTLGDLIVATYGACGEQLASRMVQLATNVHLVRFEKAVDIKLARFARR